MAIQTLQRPAAFKGSSFSGASLPGRRSADVGPGQFRNVPVPPPGKPDKPRAPRGQRGPHEDRLQGGNLKGMIARDTLRELIQGSDPKLGRWSNQKVVFTELLSVTSIQTCSIAKLIATLSQARAAGASNWPEFAKVSERLRQLEDIRCNMEEALEWVCIEDLESLICRASAAGIVPANGLLGNSKIRTCGEPSVYHFKEVADIEPEFRHLVSAVMKHISKLRILREDLRRCSQSCDIEWISNTLKVAKELGTVWGEVDDARVRLEMLQASLEEMTELLGMVKGGAESCHLKERIHKVLTSLEHLPDDTPPPLGWVLKALRVQYNQMRLEEVVGLRARLTHEMLAAEKDANLDLLRAAVAEADTQFYRMDVGAPMSPETQFGQWDDLERGRRCLAQLVEIEAELELVVTPSPIPPTPIAIITAITRADAFGCSSWTLRSAASSRLQQVQVLEASILKAVQEESEDLLREAMTLAHSAGFSSWPLLHGAVQLVRGCKQTGPQGDHALLWQSFTSATSAQRLFVEHAEAERFGGCTVEVADVEVAFIGIRLEASEAGRDEDEGHALPSMEVLVKMFEKVTGEHTHSARLAFVRSGLAVLEVRLKGQPERFNHLVAQLRANQVLDFGSEVKIAKHLYSFVSRWKDQDNQLAILNQLQRTSSPEITSTPISQQASTADAVVLTKDIIHRELELLREFATPAGASAACVKTTSDPGSLVEDVATTTSELLVQDVFKKQIAYGLAPVFSACATQDDNISVVSEATDVESAHVLRLIQAEFQPPREVLLQPAKSTADAFRFSEQPDIGTAGLSGACHFQETVEVSAQPASPSAAVAESLAESISTLTEKIQNRGYSPIAEMSCSSGPDDLAEECVASNALKTAFQALQDTDEGMGNASAISEFSDAENAVGF